MLALAMFIVGGVCGALLMALVFAGAESFRVMTLQKKLEAIKAVAKHWENRAEELSKELQRLKEEKSR